MRILQTMTGPPGTGSGTVALAVHDELERQGHEAHLFYPDVVGGPAEARPSDPRHRIWRFPLEEHGVRLPTFPKMIPDPHPREVGSSLTAKSLSEAQLRLYLDGARTALERAIEELQPDVLECHHLWAVTWAAAELGVPYVAVPHHSDQMGYRFDPRMRPYAERAAREASFILPISDHVRREVIDLYPVEPDDVLLVPPGYDARIFRPAPADPERLLQTLDIEPDDLASEPLPIVSFSGKISHTKGVDILLQANARLQRHRPTRLVIAGTGRLDEAFDADLRRRFHLDNVHFVGHRDHPTLASLHNAAVANVSPSREEGFGVAALEAMGCACPVVASRVGGLPEFVVGELVPPEDPDALAAALVELVDLPPDRRRELGRRAHERALEYSWPTIVERRLEIYAATLERRGRAGR